MQTGDVVKVIGESKWQIYFTKYDYNKTHLGSTTNVGWVGAGDYTMDHNGYIRITLGEAWPGVEYSSTSVSNEVQIYKTARRGNRSSNIYDILLKASEQNPIEIVLMGDSITEGLSASDYTPGSQHPMPTWASSSSWAALLSKHISANFPNVTVTNRGYSGQQSGYGAEQVADWVTNDKQIVLVMYGTNNRTSQAGMDGLYDDYSTIENRCNAVGAKMIPMCIIPTTPFNQAISGKYVGTMPQVHNILAGWADDNNYELIDLYDMMMEYINGDIDNLEGMGLIYVGSADNNLHIHPTDEGHAVMFKFMADRLGITSAGGGGGKTYRHRVAMYCMSDNSYVTTTLYNNRSTPYNATTSTTTAEIETFKSDLVKAGYTSFVQKGPLLCSGNIGGTAVYGVIVGQSDSGLSAVAGKMNFSSGKDFNLTLPYEVLGSSGSTSLRLWDSVEVVSSGGGSSSGGGGTDYSEEISDLQTTLNGFLHPTKYAMPCASGFTNFSDGSLYWKTPDNMVHLTAIITVNNSLAANGTVFNMPAGYRPAATVVIPAICSYESNYMPEAGGFNFNANGTAVWYGPSLGANRHIMINAQYPAA